MLPRGTIDIGWKDIFLTMYRSFKESMGTDFDPVIDYKLKDDIIICLSVRSGLDLVLNVLDFPSGSEVIVSSVNIGDMFKIMKSHKLNLVPVKIDIHTLMVDIAEVEKKITAATKAVIITHLFGASLNLEAVASLCERYNLLLIEDCAQSFTGDYYPYGASADVSLYSFGLTKTQTCLSGAITRIKDKNLMARFADRQNTLPVYDPWLYFKKSVKAGGIKIATGRHIYSFLFIICELLKIDIDAVLSSATKGFPGDSLLSQIRFRPTSAMVYMIKRRYFNFDMTMLDKRKKSGSAIVAYLPAENRIGDLAVFNTHWVLPVMTKNPAGLISFLRDRHFDSTASASRLIACPENFTAQENDLAVIIENNIVYLPVHPSVCRKDEIKITKYISDFFNSFD